MIIKNTEKFKDAMYNNKKYYVDAENLSILEKIEDKIYKKLPELTEHILLFDNLYTIVIDSFNILYKIEKDSYKLLFITKNHSYYNQNNDFYIKILGLLCITNDKI